MLLDIGDDVGALVLQTPASLAGREIEIRPYAVRSGGGGPASHHVAVLPRPGARAPVHSAVFPQLREGIYELYERPAGPVLLTVKIRGGAVTHASWPDQSGANEHGAAAP